MKKLIFYIAALALLSCTVAEAAPGGKAGSSGSGRSYPRATRQVGSTAGGANGVSTSSTSGVPNNFTVARPRNPSGSSYYYGLGGYGYRGYGYGSPAPTSDETSRNSSQTKISGYESRINRDSYPSLKSYGSSSDRVLNTYNR